MTYERWNEPSWTCDMDGSNERLDAQASFAAGFGKADPTCSCGRPTTVVWHFSSEKQEIIHSLCNRHAMALALGLMRDVAESRYGKEIADSSYKLSVHRLDHTFPKQDIPW